MAIGRDLSEPEAWQQCLGIFFKTARSTKWKGWTEDRDREGSLVTLIITAGREIVRFEHFFFF